jgi:hypothetical protein
MPAIVTDVNGDDLLSLAMIDQSAHMVAHTSAEFRVLGGRWRRQNCPVLAAYL